MVGWIDSHAHLTDESYDVDRDAMIQRAKDAGLKKILLIGCGVENTKQAIALAQTDEIFDVASGFHPEDIEAMDEQAFLEMEELWKSPKIVAVGEIGLDYYWHKEPEHRQLQREAMIRQIDKANRLNVPVIIHSRDAMHDTYEILKNHPCKKAGIMHCYSGSVEMARELVKLGYVISLAGPVTFKNAHTPKDVAKEIAIDRLLIETDSPYLTPTPYRGKRNESAYVVHVGEEIARLKEVDIEYLMDTMGRTYRRLFHPETAD